MATLRYERARRPSKQHCCLLGLSLLFGAGGCSFAALQRVPGDYKTGDDLTCTDDLSYPLIDMAGTVLSGVLAISLISAGTNQEQGSSLTGAGIASGTLALGLASSAMYGSYQVNRCRQARNTASPSQGMPLPRGDRPAPGSEGGACLDEGLCDDNFVCDAPMQTCVPSSEDF